MLLAVGEEFVSMASRLRKREGIALEKRGRMQIKEAKITEVNISMSDQIRTSTLSPVIRMSVWYQDQGRDALTSDINRVAEFSDVTKPYYACDRRTISRQQHFVKYRTNNLQASQSKHENNGYFSFGA